MSLINDALKRASSDKAPPPPPAEGLHFHTPHAPSPSHSSKLIFIVIVFVSVLGIGFGFYTFYRQETSLREKQAANNPQSAVVQSPLEKIEKIAEPTPFQPATTQTISQLPAPTPQVPQKPVPASVVSEAAPPPPATPAELHLQAIYYRLNKPSAVINGKTVEKGNIVDGARVIEIQRHKVIVETANRSQELHIQ
ncbi:MAG: hypothetical protein SFY81_13165 [Verrucomicrobiota bacterium]|nr:hypothetical protein [Verrucomicrobiota bacterium]